jgi:putative ABC transport system permease protein
MARLFLRLRYWFAERQLQADLAEELEAHRAMRQEQLERSGMTPDEAEYASRRALGNITLAREEARGVWIGPWLESVWQDASYAVRAIGRNPGFAAALILVTSLGIGATTSVFGLLDALVLKPLPVRDPDRLAYFRTPSFSYPIFSEVKARSSGIFSGFFAWNMEGVHVDWNGELEPTEVLMASGDFYPTLGIRPALGRLFGPEDDQMGGGTSGPVAVISYRCWQRRFGGDPAAIGRVVRIDRRPYTIVGVAPNGFVGVAPGLAPDLTIPLTVSQNPASLARHSTAWLHFMGRLQDGFTLEQANAAIQREWPHVLEVTTPRDMPGERRLKYLGRTTALESGYAGFSRVRNQFEQPLWLLLGLVALLFVVACASATNLLLARGVARQSELAVRLAIGASRARLVRQMLTESMVWTALGTLLGLLIASWTAGVLVTLLTSREEPIVLEVTPNWRLTVFALTLMLLTVALCSILPALRITRVAPGPGLKDPHQITGGALRKWSIGKGLVAGQVALTMVLLAGAALFTSSLVRVLSQDAGVDRSRVLVVAADAEAAGYEGDRLIRFNTDLQERLARLPGVASVSLSIVPPISDQDGNWTQSINVDGKQITPESSRYVYFNAVSAGYFGVVGIRMLQGRDFGPGDVAGSPRVVAINSALAQRFFPDQNPIGRSVSIGLDRRRQDLEIVAVVTDAKYQTLQEPTRSIAYMPVTQQGMDRNLFAEVRLSGTISSIVEPVRREVRALDGSVPLRIETVNERIRSSLVKERMMAMLASTLGGAALPLACAALYGLLAYAVSRQTKEIGLRLALGARRQTVIWMVMRDCLIVTVIGIALGVAATLALGRFASALLYQVTATDATSLLAAGTLMATVAGLAGFLPARRASRVDPVVALRID